jgi:two-component system invasion response regulator UvrY
MKAFDQVRSGKPYLSEDLATQVALLGTGVGLNPLVDLTPRQSEMLSLLAKGKTYNSIAEELGVSYKTVVNASSLNGGLARKICRS